MCYLHLVHTRDVLCGVTYNISSKSFQIFGLLLLLILDDGGFLNALLPTNLFLSTSTHISIRQGSRVIFSTLRLVVISGRFLHYSQWEYINLPYRRFYQVFNIISSIHTCYIVLGTSTPIIIIGGLSHVY
jgi:hypothetical protein